MTYKNFHADIERMNQVYELAPMPNAWYEMDVRLTRFSDILDKEFAELSDVQAVLDTADDDNRDEVLLATRVQLADLLGDIIVYCASEAQRWNIPLSDVLQIIMLSNFSKLGADGKPIKNPSNGKFEKGPFYWKPEPAIEHFMKYGVNGMVKFTNENGVSALQLNTPSTKERSELPMEQVMSLNSPLLTDSSSAPERS